MILLSTGVESAGFWHGGVEVHQLPSSQKGPTVHGWGRQAEAVHGRMLAENQAGETMSRGPRLRPLFSEGKLRENESLYFFLEVATPDRDTFRCFRFAPEIDHRIGSSRDISPLEPPRPFGPPWTAIRGKTRICSDGRTHI